MNRGSLNKALEAGALVLTVNNRLARYLKSSYDQYQLALGIKTWKTPNVIPLHTWLRQLFDKLTSEQILSLTLIETAQQQQIWSQIIQESCDEYPLLNLSGTETAVQDAWKIANSWRYDFETENTCATSDQKQFFTWVNQYRRYCTINDLIDTSTLEAFLEDNVSLYVEDLPKHIIFAGFHDLSPQQQCLFKHMNDTGIDAKHISFSPPENQTMVRVSPLSDVDELRMAALWARDSIVKDPALKVGIVIPDLHSRKNEVSYQFDKAFYPNSSPQKKRTSEQYYNISLGFPISNIPAVKSALLVLKLSISGVNAFELSELLLSRFIKHSESEQARRAVFDSSKAVKQRSFTSLSSLIHLSEKQSPALHLALCSILRIKTNEQLLPSQWGGVFNKIIELSGWPGEQSLNSEEYQQIQSLKDVLVQLSKLDQFRGCITGHEALETVYRIAKQTIFQPQSSDAPVQVLGLLELAGLEFDRLWICSMDSAKWPIMGTANAFLPIAWQRNVGAPHASASRTFEYARYQFQEIKNAGSELVFSHVALRDENTLQCASVISDLEIIEVEGKLHTQVRLDGTSLESLTDDFGTPTVKGQVTGGGSSLLSDQAACPFRAFVSHRLLAREFESNVIGVDLRDRGNFLHKLLEIFWREVSTQSSLISLSESSLRNKVEIIADMLMQEYDNYDRLRVTEKKRLIQVSITWLEMEKLRPEFEVRSIEEVRESDFHGLRIKMMIDRVDAVRTKNGMQRIIIDYKTGVNNSPNSWMLERPHDAQLPLYAITDEQVVDGICFAFLKIKDPVFKGYAFQDELIDGVMTPEIINIEKPRGKKIKISWNDSMDQWNANLGTIAKEFQTGYAKVAPESGACTYCRYEPVCRINSDDGVSS